MGGTSTQQQTMQSETNPWAAAQPMLQNILGQVNGQLGNTGLTGAETGALDSVQANANAGNPYAGQINSFSKYLLDGGGANNQAGAVNDNYQRFVQQTNPLASNTNYDPMQTPGLADALATLKSDITGSVNGQFAAAGRDMSGMNSQTLGRGLTQGMAPVIVDQYNRNVANQQNAAGNLYNAGNATAGALTGMNQQGVANQQQGVATSNDALSANNYGASQTLAVEAQRRGIPAQALALMAQIGIPMGQLGGSKNGTSSSTSEMSGAQQFATIAGGIQNLFPKVPIKF